METVCEVTWEEVAVHAPELGGRRVRVIVEEASEQKAIRERVERLERGLAMAREASKGLGQVPEEGTRPGRVLSRRGRVPLRRLLTDTGILTRFAMADDPYHDRVTAKIHELAREGWELCYASQAVREAWNVLTRPSVNGGYGVVPTRAEESRNGARAAFTFLEATPGVFRHWQRLVAKYGILGKNVHDANVVATALTSGATHVLTLNERDFRRYGEVETLVP